MANYWFKTGAKERQNYVTICEQGFENGYMKMKYVDAVYKIMFYTCNKKKTSVSLLACFSFDTHKEACEYWNNLTSHFVNS